MNLVKCSNNHFYDADKYPSCPHCAGSTGGVTMPGSVGGESEVTTGFPIGNESWGGFGSEMDGGNVTMPSDINGGINRSPYEYQSREPQMSYQTPSQDTTPSWDPMPAQPHSFDESKTVPVIFPGDLGRKNAELPTEPGEGYHPVSSRSGSSRSSRSGDESDVLNPVVGWLVCINGADYGTSFPLYHGKNFIGRNPDMDVCIAGDRTIARVRHAIIVYEPRQRKFFAQPGDAHGLFYCNDEVVLTSVVLHDRDELLIGRTTLRFVPFCDETFGWENMES